MTWILYHESKDGKGYTRLAGQWTDDLVERIAEHTDNNTSANDLKEFLPDPIRKKVTVDDE